ncbi:mitochondrial import receptor subunit TOM22 homolog [Lutzomyia longipalpis]|uniref:mitochondrial import receptor subunit TOM22 homolog n=1 Tax=Lutzomyia longipalpis TaxID=7200 RepID=UPI002483E769|nr:mitochondrial import receptor subunit TOM22 homolog [Lutzomyia longipalpis]
MDSEADTVFVDKDSGIASMSGSKDDTPERSASNALAGGDGDGSGDSYDDEPDESFGERLWGLTEMFPDPVRNVCATVTDLSTRSVKSMFKITCSASWIFFTSSILLFAPVFIEVERAQLQEAQRNQQKQALLGPSSALAATPGGGMPSLPPMSR